MENESENREYKIGDWKELFTEDMFEPEYENICVNIRKPPLYDSELPQFEPIPGYTTCTVKDIYTHFKWLAEGSTRLSNINGYSEEILGLCCSFCISSDDVSMRLCTECNKHMCDLCYTERTEEIAIQNGSRKWAERKDKLFKCFEHEKKQPFVMDFSKIVCNVCHHTSVKNRGLWLCNEKHELDICPLCIDTVEAKKLIDKVGDPIPTVSSEDESPTSSWLWKTPNEVDSMGGLGSYLNWVPVLRDNYNGATVMYNIVPGDVHYHKVVLSAVDDHGREGMFLYPDTLEGVLNRLRTKPAMTPEEEAILAGDGEDDGSFINHLVQRLGHPTYYG